MGIFDNVNWQQAVPGALMGFAGGMDPRSSPMLAQSGWNAVKSFMEQQQMQQQQEQFQERMKLYQQEMGFRQKEADRAQKRFDIEQEDRYASDFIISNIEKLGEMNEDAGDSEYYNLLNALRKEQGGNPIPYSVYAKVRDQMEFVPTPTGELGFGIGPDGNVAFVEKYKTGKGKVKWRAAKSDIRMSPEVLEQARKYPELALQAAERLDQSGKKEIAGTLRDLANRVLGEKKAAAFEKSYAESINEIKAENKMMEDTFKLRFSEESRPTDPAKAVAWEKDRENALRGMQEHANDRFDQLNRMRGEADPEFKKQYEKEKGRDAKEFEASMTDDERQLYAWMAKDLRDSGVSKDRAGRTARATIELRRKKGRNVSQPQGIPGDITAPGYKRTTAPPAAAPVASQPVMRSSVPPQFSAPATPGPGYVHGADWARGQVAAGKQGQIKQLQAAIELAKRRGDLARARRLEQELSALTR